MGKSKRPGYYIKFAVLSLLFHPVLCNAQELWVGGTVDIDIIKDLYVELETQIRSSDGMATYNGYYGEASAGYKINKHLKIKATYRYTNKAGHHNSEIRPTNNRERVSGDVNLDFGDKISFKYRLKYQHARERNTNKKYNYIRNKVGIDYDLHNMAKPFIAGEIYYRLDNKNELRAFRYTIGLDSGITKNLSIKSFFRVEKEINVDYPTKYYIMGIMFSYDI